MEKCKGVWWYLKVEGKYRHHPSRGRKYMLDDAASRKSDNDGALGRCGRCTSPHKVCGKSVPRKKAEKKIDPGTVLQISEGLSFYPPF